MKELKKGKKLTLKEKKDLKIEILEKISALATAGFGLVAALAWNDAIKKLFSKVFPRPAGNIIALFVYAAIITIVVVIITVYLGRAVNFIKSGRRKKEAAKEKSFKINLKGK